ncbi:MAG TPA: nitroreductase family protein [Bacteroidales bacterium]|nr:nitroreductase family protein [Bacteroidales bacterium]
MLKELFTRNRSYRRFHQDVNIPLSDLEDMIDNARLSASGRNAQPLKYILINDKDICTEVFPLLAWAGFLKDWDGPVEGERPSAYIIQMHDTEIAGGYFCDDGIAAQAIMLTAVEKDFGGCIIASVRREALAELLHIPAHLRVLHVFALGKPKEMVVIDDMKDGDIRYWRDEDNVHHVPKRPLSEIIINIPS